MTKEAKHVVFLWHEGNLSFAKCSFATSTESHTKGEKSQTNTLQMF